MIRSVIIAAASVALAAPALAADLPYETPVGEYAAPVAAASTWTGGYVGAQAGYAWGDADNRNRPNTRPDGAVVGAFAGYNQQFDGSPVVVGVETDINYNAGSDSRNFAGGRIKNEQQWSGATRGRIGYAFDRVMAYGAGGVAYGGQKVRVRDGAEGGSDKATAVGYTVGAGVEGLVTENVTARVEYRYTDYGAEKFKTGAGREKTSLSENKVMGGVAYKFGW